MFDVLPEMLQPSILNIEDYRSMTQYSSHELNLDVYIVEVTPLHSNHTNSGHQAKQANIPCLDQHSLVCQIASHHVLY